ncbi:UDP-glycosyltransferase 73B4 [Striga hermonthica]|uniref:Glycosyltransferase n=1 Tax=Striga hermonthica TaxID=68872 RepID=A0A9N7RJ12_STRHE|nr:UDP-glycosyltransferase 73B4 [Striga hermonthica]
MATTTSPHENGQRRREKPKVAIVMVPLPAQGHLNQLLHLSCRLVSTANLPVYFTCSGAHVRQAKLRAHGWEPSDLSKMHFHELPTPTFENPAPDPNAPTRFPSQLVPSFSATVALRDPFFSFVQNLSKDYTRVIVVYDSLMAYVVQDLDSMPNAECYTFWSVSAFASYFFRWHMSGKPDLPGEAGLVLKEAPSPDGLFPPELEEFFKLQLESKKRISGSIQNTNRLIEGTYLDLLAEAMKDEMERHFAVGPFNPVPVRSGTHECLDWLDKQGTPSSVMFVSFGSTTSIPDEQIRELATGLERSGQKFVWVLRDADKGDIFTGGEARRPVLPEGFEERVKERGLVVREWAPQLEILGHFATGGFMSHCGWNSCMESISAGVPIIAWPMHSDQPANAVLMTKVLKIGVEVVKECREEMIVPASAIESVVRRLMDSEEGDEIRRRAQELGVAVRDSVKEGGVSKKELDSFISHITR